MNTLETLAPDLSGIVPELFGFEGAEKKVEIEFKVDDNIDSADRVMGLRLVPRSAWEDVLAIIKCQIMSVTKNKHFDSYVLSESSLFVYPAKVILKTCGTTILLQCLSPIIEIANQYCGMTPDFIWFARKNYQYPDKQLYPHTSFDDEVDHLNRHFSNGSAYIMGPRNGEHWHLYVCDMKDRDHVGDDQTLEIIMTDLDETVMKQFYQADNPSFLSAKETTKTSGIIDLLPGSITDEIQFEPCGYSVNGLLDESYFTIHITPEPHCSFVSFETNVPKENYTELISTVVNTFKPGKFTVTLFADNGSLAGPSSITAFDPKGIERLGFALKYKSFSEFDGTYDLNLCHFQKVEPVEAITAAH